MGRELPFMTPRPKRDQAGERGRPVGRLLSQSGNAMRFPPPRTPYPGLVPSACTAAFAISAQVLRRRERPA